MDEISAGELLNSDRTGTLARIQAMVADFDAIVAASADANADDEHDPEGSTIAFERAQLASLLTQARAHLADIDSAMTRLRDGSYSICAECGAPISAERLAARPAARTCISCAERPERNGA